MILLFVKFLICLNLVVVMLNYDLSTMSFKYIKNMNDCYNFESNNIKLMFGAISHTFIFLDFLLCLIKI